MCRSLICSIFCVAVLVTTSAHADKLSGLADVTVVNDAIVSLRYGGTEYVVANGDLVLGTTTRWYVIGGVEHLWPDGNPVPAGCPTVSGTSNPKVGDIGANADNFLFRLNGATDISSIDGINFEQTIFPFLTDTFFLFERGGNDTGTWQAIRADGSLGVPVTFSAASVYANTGVNVNGQNAFGVVFTTDVPVQGVRITASGHDTLSISTPKPRVSKFASNPKPDHEAKDVPRDVTLSWKPGIYADKHDVYFGTNFNDVNDASRTNPLGVLVSQNQEPNSYSPTKVLQWEQTYYWRVDEVNAPPDLTIFKGGLWQFTVEPFAYPIAGANITATASSQFSASTGPQNTVNSSGLDAGDLHSTAEIAIWLSSMTGAQPTWIQFEFDSIYRLHQMWVWNCNQLIEPVVGFGIKEAAIEYSVDGVNWTILGTTHQFARAPGTAGYAHNTTVDFSSIVAKYVKITAKSNWGGVLPQYGLSEVRFFYIPVVAREPNPASEAINVGVDNVTVSWRAGREAAKHNVYLSDSNQAVIDGTAPVTTVSQASYGPLSLNLGKTYYWRVDEVNEAQTPTTWQGNVWNFSTQQYFVIEDFEDYNDFEPDRIFDTWIDGWNVPANGSQVGYAEPPFAEKTIIHGGKQSMPLNYDNTTTASYSEATANVANLKVGKDWTKYGIKTLTLYFYGDPNNSVTEKMYVKLNGSKVIYNGDAANLRRTAWQPWNIELTLFGVNLRNVTELIIGFERSGAVGGKGKVYFDDIRLYGVSALQPVITIGSIASLDANVDPTDPKTLVSAIAIDGHHVSELILGTTTADFEKFADHPAAHADDDWAGWYGSHRLATRSWRRSAL